MTLEKLIIAVQKDMPDADGEMICRAVNEVEHRIREDILYPAGVNCRGGNLELKKDHGMTLLLADQHLSLYLSYICAAVALSQADIQYANAYTELFNQRFEELATEYRRKYPPQKVTSITGVI